MTNKYILIKDARRKNLIIFSLLGIEKDIRKPLLYEELIEEYAAKSVEGKRYSRCYAIN